MKLIEALNSLKNIAIRSFYCKKLYLDVTNNWSGYGQKYLIMITFIMSLPITFLAATTLSNVFDIVGNVIQMHDGQITNSSKQDQESAKFIHEIITKIPELHIKNGKITANNDQKMVIYSDSIAKDVMVINTSPKALPDSNYLLNINYNSISFNRLTINLEDQLLGKDLIIDENKLIEFIKDFYKTSMSSYFTLINMSIIYFVLAVYFKLMVNVIGLLGINLVLKMNLKTESIFRIVAISATPAISVIGLINITIYLVYLISGINLMNAGTIGIQNQLFSLISIGYLFFAFVHIRKSNQN